MTRLLLLLLLGCAAPQVAPPAEDLPGRSLYRLDVSMTDHEGRTMTWSDLRGRPAVVAMVYATCNTACPMTVKEISTVLDKAHDIGTPVFLFTLDPEHDDPPALRAMHERHALEPRWRLVRTEPADVQEIAAALGIRYRELTEGEYAHTPVIAVLDAQGVVAIRQDGLGQSHDALITALHEERRP